MASFFTSPSALALAVPVAPCLVGASHTSQSWKPPRDVSRRSRCAVGIIGRERRRGTSTVHVLKTKGGVDLCMYASPHPSRADHRHTPQSPPPPPLGAPPKPSVFSAREVTLASSLPPLSRSPDPDGPYIKYETPPNVKTGLPVVLWYPKFWRMDGRRQTGSSLTRVLKRMELLGGSHGMYGTVFGEGGCLPALADQTIHSLFSEEVRLSGLLFRGGTGYLVYFVVVRRLCNLYLHNLRLPFNGADYFLLNPNQRPFLFASLFRAARGWCGRRGRGGGGGGRAGWRAGRRHSGRSARG